MSDLRQALKHPKAVTCSDCRVRPLCLPRGLDAEQLSRLARVIQPQRPVPRGHVLFRQGDPLSALHLVKSGSVKTVTRGSDGLEQVTGFYLPGDLIGVDGIDSGRHQVSAVMLEYGAVCELPYDALSQAVAATPEVFSRVLDAVSREMAVDRELRFMMSHCSAEQRLIMFLLDLAGRLGARGFSDRELALPMSRYDIANYLGLSAETVSRGLSRLEAEGLIAVDRRHITLLERAALAARVEHCGPCPLHAVGPHAV